MRALISDVRRAYAVLAAAGWTHEQCESVLGRRCVKCMSLRDSGSFDILCRRCATHREAKREILVVCPVCKKSARKRASLRMIYCSPACRRHAHKCRVAGVSL